MPQIYTDRSPSRLGTHNAASAAAAAEVAAPAAAAPAAAAVAADSSLLQLPSPKNSLEIQLK